MGPKPRPQLCGIRLPLDTSLQPKSDRAVKIRLDLQGFRYLVYRGSERNLSAAEKAIMSPDQNNHINLVLTTYETVASRFTFLGHYPWYCVVVDEGHRGLAALGVACPRNTFHVRYLILPLHSLPASNRRSRDWIVAG